MPASLQLITLGASFLYGFIFYYLMKLNYKLIKNKKRFYQSLITILFMYNIVLLYIIIIFKINNGIFHFYFFIMITLGFFTNLKLTQKMLKNVKCRSFIEKIKKKCYTIKNRGDQNKTQSNQKRTT